MTIAIGLAFLVMLIGGFVYIVADGKWSEMGRIAFFVGLFFLVSGAAEAVTLVVK